MPNPRRSQNAPGNPFVLPARWTRWKRWRALLLAIPFVLAACSRFHHVTKDYVYVAARQATLHDRLAAVSNRVGTVSNGEALEVLERTRRFVKVRTPKGEIGWLEEHAIIDDKLYAQFQDLAKKHAQDAVIATGQLRDDLYLHIQPGRETAHFLLIPGNAKVQLLERGSIAKAAAPGTIAPKPKPPVAAPSTPTSATATVTPTKSPAANPPARPAPVMEAPAPPPMAPPPMEDWWLIRDASGHTGWLIASRLDVDVPDEVAQYAEGQRMVAAYPLAKVTDDGIGQAHHGKDHEKEGKKSRPTKPEVDETPAEGAPPTAQVFTEYVTVLAPPKGGLPYDFDQVRVFTWSLNHHRYETGYRLRGIQGYLPVKISSETVNGQQFPVFSFAIADGVNVSIDPDTGVTKPVNPRTLSFRLEGNIIRRTGADQAPITPNHDEADKENAKSKSAKSKSTKKKNR